MYPLLVSTTALQLLAILVLLVVVPLVALAVIAGAAEYVRQGAESELAALSEAGAFEDESGFEDGSGDASTDSGSHYGPDEREERGPAER